MIQLPEIATGQPMEQDYYTVKQLAEKVQFKPKQIRKATQEGKIPGASKMFGQWRYRIIEVEKSLLNGTFGK